MVLSPKKILITGATSGLGWALAEEYAAKDITLFLTGRNQERLDQITKICQDKKALVISQVIDIWDNQAFAQWINQVGNQFGLDLVIANAGISAGTAQGLESENQIKQIFATNIDGVLNTINPAIALMRDLAIQNQNNLKSQEKIYSKSINGQIAIISSLAGFRGLPSSPAYSASKACVRVYGEALRGSLLDFGIAVSVVCPGYIKTPMTDVNNFPMPILISANKAAQIIKKSLARNKSRIAFPVPLYFIVWLAALVSNVVVDPIFAKLPKKKSLDNCAITNKKD